MPQKHAHAREAHVEQSRCSSLLPVSLGRPVHCRLCPDASTIRRDPGAIAWEPSFWYARYAVHVHVLARKAERLHYFFDRLGLRSLDHPLERLNKHNETVCKLSYMYWVLHEPVASPPDAQWQILCRVKSTTGLP